MFVVGKNLLMFLKEVSYCMFSKAAFIWYKYSKNSTIVKYYYNFK